MTYEVVLDNARMQMNCFELPPFYEDKYVTRARLIRTTPLGTWSDAYVDLGPGHPPDDIDFYNFFGGANTTSHLYVIEIDEVTQPDPSYISTPSGYALARVQPWVEGYIVGPAQTTGSGGSGYSPEPPKKPFLVGLSGSENLTFSEDWIAWPGQRMFCHADDDPALYLATGMGLEYLKMEPVDGVTTHLVVTNFGFRFYYEGA